MSDDLQSEAEARHQAAQLRRPQGNATKRSKLATDIYIQYEPETPFHFDGRFPGQKPLDTVRTIAEARWTADVCIERNLSSCDVWSVVSDPSSTNIPHRVATVVKARGDDGVFDDPADEIIPDLDEG